MTAVEAAAAEARGWADLAAAWRTDHHAEAFADVAPRESDVVRFHDPADDLIRRMRRWGYPPGALDLSDLARFAAGLAQAEADGWEHDEGHVATRAYEDRRFLLGDRLLHWAVPWLDGLGRAYPDRHERAELAIAWLLGVAEHMRPAPILASGEGRFPPGHDAIGPLRADHDLDEVVLSIWSGAVVFGAALASMAGRPVPNRAEVRGLLGDRGFRRDLSALYHVAGDRWRQMVDAYPGSAEVWAALGERAAQTESAIG